MSRKKRSKKQQKKQKVVKSQAGEISFEIKLEFQAPFISQASGVMAMGLDAAMQRNSDDIPVINGSLIRGNILHALKEFQQRLDDDRLKQNIASWFGESSASNESKEDSYKPQRANADFDFYWVLETDESINQQRTRIAIGDNGTVKHGALQVIEDCFPTGSDDNPIFTGKVTLRYKLGNEAKIFEQWLNKALQYIPAMGSFKGIGFGKLLNGEISKDTSKQQVQHAISTANRFALIIEVDRPFCIGKPVTPDSNRIVSDEYIAGNVIKALIARTYHNEEKKLQEELCFNDIIISHALPAIKSKLEGKPERNTPLALSLAILNDKENKLKIIDLAEKTEDAFIEAPSFAIDWKPKNRNEALDLLDRKEVSLDRIIMLRTGIDAKKGISKENELFSLECINPENHVWCADIDLVNVPEKQRQRVLQKLQAILRKGLSGMGKTKARVAITLQKEPFSKTDTLTQTDTGHYIISLTTAAKLLPQNMQIAGTNGDKQLEDYYQQYWHQIDKGIKLKRYFAQQTLTSSYYHTQMHHPSDKYHPDWLTNAGSVFVLDIHNDTALKALQACVARGLPTYCDNETNKPNWRNTPFLPEHGYGEIQVKTQEEMT